METQNMAIGLADFDQMQHLAEWLTEWYWQYGPQRASEWQLGSSWLERLYSLRQQMTALAALPSRSTLGIWGPSQAGKSSMLTSYLDVQSGDQDPQGVNSALTWDLSSPARFRGVEATKVSLNPFNGGKDATGCVTRYVLRDSVENSAYPVEIRLCSRKALIHALAAGYLSECNLKDRDGVQVVWDIDKLDDLLCNRSFIASVDLNTVPQREAYELLREVCDIVKSLIGLNVSRYQNLGRRWSDFATSRIMGNLDLTGNMANARKFMNKLLWDEKQGLSGFLVDLESYYNRQLGLHRQQRLFCSLEAASVIINIAAYEFLCNPIDNEQVRAIAARIPQLSYSQDPATGNLYIGLGGPQTLFPVTSDFGYFQACVQELVVPIHKVPGMPQAFADFLDKADFLDFPGIALATNQDGDESVLLEPATLQKDDYRILTKIMKRGRTASIISSYSEQGDIDSFVLAVRAGQTVNNASQLINGIQQWWHFENPQFNPNSPALPPPLPLFLVLTFCADLVNDVIRNHGVGIGLNAQFDWLDILGPMATSRLSRIFVTTYKFRGYARSDIFDAQLNLIKGDESENHPEILRALEAIHADASFRKLFGEPGNPSYESFDRMARSQDGGTDYLFESVTKAIDSGRKRALREHRRAEAAQAFRQLLEEALPATGDTGALRQQFLTQFADKLEAAVTAPLTNPQAQKLGFDTQEAWVSYLVRSLQAVRPEKFPLPTEKSVAAAEDGNIPYVQEVLRSLDRQLPEFADGWLLGEIGLMNKDDAYKLALYLSERSFPWNVEGQISQISLYQGLCMWLDDNSMNKLVPLTKMQQALAIVMENVIWRGYGAVSVQLQIGNELVDSVVFRGPSVQEFIDLQSAIKKIETSNQLKRRARFGINAGSQPPCSPEYQSIIKPFVDYVRNTAAQTAPGTRPPQTGDNELNDIKTQCGMI